MKVITEVYRSPKKEGLYLFVEKGQDLEELPPVMLTQFGKPELSMTLVLTEDKKLARASAAEVLASIEKQGFYLQMPPSPHDKRAEDEH